MTTPHTPNDGGAAFPRECSRCMLPAIRLQGRQWLCAKHYRFGQMRATARRHGKTVPTYQELELLVLHDLSCPECRTPMNWLAEDGQATVASLQHYRDGRFGVICRSCNTRHAFAPGDSFREMPKDQKYCPRCATFKHDSAFTADNGRSGSRRLASWCAACKHQHLTEWRKAQREQYNQYQREYRAKRKAEGNPVRGGA